MIATKNPDMLIDQAIATLELLRGETNNQEILVEIAAFQFFLDDFFAQKGLEQDLLDFKASFDGLQLKYCFLTLRIEWLHSIYYNLIVRTGSLYAGYEGFAAKNMHKGGDYQGLLIQLGHFYNAIKFEGFDLTQALDVISETL